MLPEISLSILDITQNSITAKASRIDLLVERDTKAATLLFEIRDNGCGMSLETCQKVQDPFYTTRTTRKVGLGIPFLKQSAQSTDGSFEITSQLGQGTTMRALFHTDHIDCMPLGDLAATIHSLIVFNEEIRFVFRYRVDGEEFLLDTEQLKGILGDVSFKEQEVSCFIEEYIKEHLDDLDGK